MNNRNKLGFIIAIIQFPVVLALVISVAIQFHATADLKTTIAKDIGDLALKCNSDAATNKKIANLYTATHYNEKDNYGYISSDESSYRATDSADSNNENYKKSDTRYLTSDKFATEAYNDYWATEKIGMIYSAFDPKRGEGIGLSERYANVIIEAVDCRSTTCKITLDYSSLEIGEEEAITDDIMKIMIAKIHGCGFTITPVSKDIRKQDVYLECDQ